MPLPSLSFYLTTGIQLFVIVLTLWIAILHFRRGSVGSRLMVTGAAIGLVITLVRIVLTAIYLTRAGHSYGFGNSYWVLMIAPPILASFGLLLFLIGALLHALRGSSESARIAELEAIIRDRDSP